MKSLVVLSSKSTHLKIHVIVLVLRKHFIVIERINVYQMCFDFFRSKRSTFIKALEIKYKIMDCYLLDIHWLREAFEGIGARDQALEWGIRTNLIFSNFTFMVHVTDYGPPMKPFFIGILNFCYGVLYPLYSAPF